MTYASGLGIYGIQLSFEIAAPELNFYSPMTNSMQHNSPMTNYQPHNSPMKNSK
jgi:hypothetical protein